MMSKKLFMGGILAALLLMAALPAAAQTSSPSRIGVLDIGAAQDKFEYLRQNLTKLEEEKNSYQNVINEEQQRIQEIQKKRDALKGPNASAEIRQLSEEMDRRLLELKSYRDKSLHELQIKGEKLDSDMRDKFKTVIEDVAKSLNLDLVVEQSIVLYSKDELDITEIVAAELNKRFPPSLTGGIK